MRASPALRWKQRGKVGFDVVRILRARKTEPARHPPYMCVDRERRCAERVVHHHTCSLPSHTGELVQLLAGARELASMLARDLPHGGLEILRLGTEKADPANHALELGDARPGVVLRRPVPR